MVRYLNGIGDRRMCVFPQTLRYSLQRHLAIDKGDSLVRDAQDFAIEVQSLLSIVRHSIEIIACSEN